MKDKINLSIRMDKQLHDRFQYVAEYEGRSMSKQVLHLLNHCVQDFEQEHGAIHLPGEGAAWGSGKPF